MPRLQQHVPSLILAIMTAACNPADAADPETTLEIKPSICVLAADEDTCRETIDITWQSPSPLDACLYQSAGEPETLDCWRNSDAGALSTRVEIATNNHFELRSRLDNTVLAHEILRVMREQQRLRNRRRNPWSFF